MDAFRTRVDWARNYAEELKETSDAFMRQNEEGSAVKVERDPNAGWLRVSVHLPDGFPDNLGRIVGGGLHQLRSALDNLAYQLVLAGGGTPDKQTAFPILETCPEGEFAAKTDRRLKGMSGTAKAAIEGLQPYNAWPEHPDNSMIWLINELNNIDKHRIAHLACLWIAKCEVDVTFLGGTLDDVGARVESEHGRGIAEHDATLYELKWSPTLYAVLREKAVKVDLNGSADVALRNPERTGFLDYDLKPIDAMPLHHFFNMALDYLETVVAPAFASEFT